jgi:hypothetical protein
MWPLCLPSGANTWFLAPVRLLQLRISASSSVRGLRRDAVAQPADEIQKVAPAVLPIRRIQSERHPDLSAVVHHIRPGRHHADDFAAHVVDVHRLPDHRTPAERVLPQLVRQDHDTRGLPRRRRRAGHIGLPFSEHTSVCRLDAECVKQMLVDVGGPHANRAIVGEEILLACRERAD